jgi:hypothetical protein
VGPEMAEVKNWHIKNRPASSENKWASILKKQIGLEYQFKN